MGLSAELGRGVQGQSSRLRGVDANPVDEPKDRSDKGYYKKGALGAEGSPFDERVAQGRSPKILWTKTAERMSRVISKGTHLGTSADQGRGSEDGAGSSGCKQGAVQGKTADPPPKPSSGGAKGGKRPSGSGVRKSQTK